MAVAILDADDAFLWTNRLFRELAKYSSEELASMRWTDVVRGWTDRDDHVLLCGNKELLNCKVDRWPVSGFQVALVHGLFGADEFGARSQTWLSAWFDGVGGFASEKIGALRISFEIGFPDEELEAENDRIIFRLFSKGRVVVHLGEDSYLLVFDGRVTSLPEIIRDVRLLFDNSGKVAFEAAVAPSRSGKTRRPSCCGRSKPRPAGRRPSRATGSGPWRTRVFPTPSRVPASRCGASRWSTSSGRLPGSG